MNVKKIADDILSKIPSKEEIYKFFLDNPDPSDKLVHEWAESNGYDEHVVEELIYKIVTDHIQKHVNIKKGFVTNIEEDTINNDNFREVLYTGKKSQLVLMSIKPNEDIGEEVHENVDQFFRIDGGGGKVIINGVEHEIEDGSAFVIPSGARHNVINTGDEDLKLYSIYSPPEHADGTIHRTKQEAIENEEHFDGKTTE